MNKLPSGWKIEKLENIALVERGKFSVRPRNDPRYFGGNMPFVQTGDISSAKTYLTQYTQTLNEQGISVSKVFPKDTILITIAANIGDTAITTFDVACPDSVVAIQPYKDKANVFWLKQVLETKKAELDAQSTQNAQKNINLQVLKPLIIKTPPLEEQIQIAETLSTWDNAIQTTEKLLENSRQQKKALMQRLLNGKDWEETKLQNLCKIVTGKKDVNEGNDKGIYPFFTCAKEHTYSDSYSFECEALLIAGNGVVGQTTYYKGKFEAYQRTYVLYEFKGINVQYLYQYIKWHLQKDIEREKQHGAMPYIKLGLLTDFVVKLPKSNEQQKIAEILSTADQEIETLQRKLECLKLEKGALMQRLLA